MQASLLDRRKLGWLLVAILGLGPLLAFAAVLGPDRGLFFRDHELFFRPAWGSIHRALSSGILPVLNENQLSGVPHELSTNYALFTPLTAVLLLGSFDTSYDLFIISHFVLLALGTWLLARRLGASEREAFAATLIVSLAGPVIAFENLVVGLQGIAWTPWLFWAIVRALDQPTLGAAGLVGIAFALAAQAVMPELALLDLVVMISLGLRYRQRIRPRHFGMLALGGALGLAMASIDLIPLFRALQGSSRLAGFDYEVSSGWALSPAQVLELFVPAFWTPPEILFFNLPDITGSPNDPPYLTSLYMGTGLSLALAAPWWKERRARWLLLAALLCFLVAAGHYTPLHRIVSSLPVLRSSRFAIKYALLAVPAIAYLAALTIGRLEDRIGPLIVASGAQLIFLIGLFFTVRSSEFGEFLGRSGRPYANRPIFEFFKDGDIVGLVQGAMVSRVLHALTFALMLFVAAALFRARPTWRGPLRWVLPAIVLLDLALGAHYAIPSAPVEYSRMPPAIEAVLAQSELRAAPSPPPPIPHVGDNTPFEDYLLNQGRHGWLAWDVFRTYGTADLEGLTVSETHRTMRKTIEAMPWEKMQGGLARAGVGHVLWSRDLDATTVALGQDAIGRPVHLYRIEGARAALSARTRWRAVSASSTSAIALISDADQLEVAVVLDASRPSSTSSTACEVRLTRTPGRHPESFEADVDSECESLVVLTEVRVPGYEATIDEQASPILDVEVGYMGLRVPPGRHHLRFEYASWARRGWPIALSALAAAALSIIFSLWFGRARRSPAAP